MAGVPEMSVTERERFLAEPRIAVLSVADGARGPLALPIWYLYEPGGEVRIITPRASRKAVLIERAGRFTLTVQQDTRPYLYVGVEGPIAAIETATVAGLFRPLCDRYLPPADADAYVASLTPAIEAGTRVEIRMRPERWRTRGRPAG